MIILLIDIILLLNTNKMGFHGNLQLSPKCTESVDIMYAQPHSGTIMDDVLGKPYIFCMYNVQ